MALLSLSDVNSLLQAQELFRKGEYSRSEMLYEELIENNPSVLELYWRFGLVRLLQGREEEAQLTWMMVMSEGEVEEVEQWSRELFHLLQEEANWHQQNEQLKASYLIRQHSREINPRDLTNLLQLIQLAIALKYSVTEALKTTELQHWLSLESPSANSFQLLDETFEKLMDAAPEEPMMIEALQTYLSHISQNTIQTEAWVKRLLKQINWIYGTLDDKQVALQYSKLCLKISPEITAPCIAGVLQDTRHYEQGIQLAKRHAETCETPLEQLKGNVLILRGLMATGARWDEVIPTVFENTKLIENLLSTTESNSNEKPDALLLSTATYFYPYISDNPAETRQLQNQIATLYQKSVNEKLDTNAEYQSYPRKKWTRTSDRQRIRIGYLSRCLKMHSVGWLSRWVFEHFDRNKFEVYAFFNQQLEINFFSEEWFAEKATVAYGIGGSYLEVARQIQEQEIDILVDLDSITNHNTVAVLALKPAPIQVTWLGTDAIGLPSIDYFIADSYVLPDNAQEYYQEKIWRLPQTYIAVDGFEIGIPTLRRDQLEIPNDAVIYFSSQVAYKRNPKTIRLQMQILANVPGSYFLIKGLGDEQGIQELFNTIAEKEGVSPDRLRFLPPTFSEFEHRADLGIADVVLDTFPYNGATTTMETLWMGVPMVTLVGQQFAARNSYGMMMNAGITEGIAFTPEEYVEWGVRLGKDEALRQQIHWKLLRSRQTSPLWNARQFTRDLEAAYEQMWQRYLETQG